MNFRQLSNFLRLAELGNFSTAADAIGITQSALSRQIAGLEDDLEVKLFDRTRPQVSLTPEGVLFRNHANHVVAYFDDVRDELKAKDRAVSGEVAIGSHPDFAGLLFPLLVATLRESYPGLRLHLVEGFTHTLEDLLAAGTLDLAVVGSQEPCRNIALEPLASESVFLVSAPGFAPGLRRECTIADIAGLPLILSSVWARERIDLERIAAERGVTLDVAIDVDGLSSMKQLARSGHGHMVRPWSSICSEPDREAWHLSRIEGLSVVRLLAHRRDRQMSRAARLVERDIHRCVDQLEAQGAMR